MNLLRPFLDRYARAAGKKRRRGAASGVLILSFGGIGDTVLFARVFPRFAKLARPGEKVTLLLRKDGAKMGFLFPEDVEILAVDPADLRKTARRGEILADLAARHFRLAVSTDFLRHPDLDEALIEAAGALESLAMAPRSWPKHDRRLAKNRALYARLFDSGAAHRDKQIRWNDFADWLLGEKETLKPPALRPPAASRDRRAMIQPFSAVKEKQIPAAAWKKIVDGLPGDMDVAILGAPADLDKNPEYRDLIDGVRVRFDDAPFRELLPRLSAARLVISVDTALMHLAAALGTPTLCIASAAYVGEIVPYAPEATPANLKFLYRPMPCEGCLGACKFPPERNMWPCLAQVTEQEMLAAVREMLA